MERTFYANPGVAFGQTVDFRYTFIKVDNPTNQWLYVSAANAYIAPYTTGWQRNVVKTAVIDVEPRVPTGGPNITPDGNQVVITVSTMGDTNSDGVSQAAGLPAIAVLLKANPAAVALDGFVHNLIAPVSGKAMNIVKIDFIFGAGALPAGFAYGQFFHSSAATFVALSTLTVQYPVDHIDIPAGGGLGPIGNTFQVRLNNNPGMNVDIIIYYNLV